MSVRSSERTEGLETPLPVGQADADRRGRIGRGASAPHISGCWPEHRSLCNQTQRQAASEVAASRGGGGTAELVAVLTTPKHLLLSPRPPPPTILASLFQPVSLSQSLCPSCGNTEDCSSARKFALQLRLDYKEDELEKCCAARYRYLIDWAASKVNSVFMLVLGWFEPGFFAVRLAGSAFVSLWGVSAECTSWSPLWAMPHPRMFSNHRLTYAIYHHPPPDPA